MAGGRALPCLLAALGLLSALSAAGTLFLLAQWRQLGAALRQLEVANGDLRDPPGHPAPLGPGPAPPARSKRSRRGERGRGEVRAENEEMLMLLTYSMVPVGRRCPLRALPAKGCRWGRGSGGGVPEGACAEPGRGWEGGDPATTPLGATGAGGFGDSGAEAGPSFGLKSLLDVACWQLRCQVWPIPAAAGFVLSKNTYRMLSVGAY